MSGHRHIYGEVKSKSHKKKVSSTIRGDVATATSRQALTQLTRRALN
jgi:hypothetical protein